MKRVSVLSVICALTLLWCRLADAGAEYDDYSALDSYDLEVSPAQWQQSQPEYQDYSEYTNQTIDMPGRVSNPPDLNQQVQSAPFAYGAISSRELRNLLAENTPLDKLYDRKSITSNDEYFRLKWLAQDQSMEDSDPFYKAMLGLYIKHNGYISDDNRKELLDDLMVDSANTPYPPIPSSYEDYAWMIDESGRRGSDSFDRDLLAGYIRSDNLLSNDQKQALLQQAKVDTAGIFESNTLYDIKPLDRDYIRSLTDPGGLSAITPDYANAAPPLTKEQIWGNPASIASDMPFESYRSINDYYREMADKLLDTYRSDNLN